MTKKEWPQKFKKYQTRSPETPTPSEIIEQNSREVNRFFIKCVNSREIQRTVQTKPIVLIESGSGKPVLSLVNLHPVYSNRGKQTNVGIKLVKGETNITFSHQTLPFRFIRVGGYFSYWTTFPRKAFLNIHTKDMLRDDTIKNTRGMGRSFLCNHFTDFIERGITANDLADSLLANLSAYSSDI